MDSARPLLVSVLVWQPVVQVAPAAAAASWVVTAVSAAQVPGRRQAPAGQAAPLARAASLAETAASAAPELAPEAAPLATALALAPLRARAAPAGPQVAACSVEPAV